MADIIDEMDPKIADFDKSLANGINETQPFYTNNSNDDWKEVTNSRITSSLQDVRCFNRSFVDLV